MARKQHKYHFIYRTTNTVNNKFYVGMHSTDNLQDGYIGSGRRLWVSIRKYGKENHKFEILEYCLDRESLKQREKEIVNEQFLRNSLCLNLQPGGAGGFINEAHQLKCASAGGKVGGRVSGKRSVLFMHKYWKEHPKEQSELGKRNVHFLNSKKAIEKKKRTFKKINYQQGSKNSQYGKCWIFSDVEQKSIKIKNEDLNKWLKLGWQKGRKIKWSLYEKV